MRYVSSILVVMWLLSGPGSGTLVALGQESAAAAAFREARDLVNAGEWGKAEEHLKRFVAEFARDREIPAARYWLAFALKQQEKLPAADEVLTQLIAQHPQSPWVGDARAMRVEIAPRLKNTTVIEQAVTDANEEIRLAALQSLFEARPQTAIGIAIDLLKDQSASRMMREAALELLADAEAEAAVPVLLQIARSDADLRLRVDAIEALADIRRDSPVDDLASLLASTTEPEVRKAVIEALAEHDSVAAEKALIDQARSGDVETRRNAIEALGDRADDERATPAAMQSLIALYDAERDERLKQEIIEAFAESRDTAALKKLMQIAAGDSSIRLRKAALSAIGDSEHPDAARFLEDILKK